MGMFTLILLVIIGLSFGYFATQNTMNIPVNIAGSTFRQVPLYIVLGITLLIGLALSWIISVVDSIYVSMTLHGKDNVIKDAKRTNSELVRQIRQLELENATLRGELDHDRHDHPVGHPATA
jgi:uncharacterized membrane protein YciS (DUF1049 family)